MDEITKKQIDEGLQPQYCEVCGRMIYQIEWDEQEGKCLECYMQDSYRRYKDE